MATDEELDKKVEEARKQRTLPPSKRFKRGLLLVPGNLRVTE